MVCRWDKLPHGMLGCRPSSASSWSSDGSVEAQPAPVKERKRVIQQGSPNSDEEVVQPLVLSKFSGAPTYHALASKESLMAPVAKKIKDNAEIIQKKLVKPTAEATGAAAPSGQARNPSQPWEPMGTPADLPPLDELPSAFTTAQIHSRECIKAVLTACGLERP